MLRLVSPPLALCLGLLGSGPLQAKPFAIDLQAQAGKETQTAHAEVESPGVKPKPRLTLNATAGMPVRVKWVLSNTDKEATFKDVLVHFFVVKEEKPGQTEVPKLNRDVLAESALTMDFKPGDKAEGEITLSVAKPGCYLIRLQTREPADRKGQEHFAALDLVVR
jgi:hypothetical protein